MIDDWFDAVRLPISFPQFLQLPTNPAYKYEYFSDYALLTPRPKCYHASLDLALAHIPEGIDEDAEITIRPLRDDDWDHLPELFSAAFHGVQPFASLDDDRRLEAARQCLAKTRGGGDGAMVEVACHVAVEPDDGRPIGVALVTLQPHSEDDDFDFPSREKTAALPLGPHLTWIFIAPMLARHGVGSMLLAAVVGGLLPRGDNRLDSTFLLGNESSTLWHWRNGFRLRSHPFSTRRFHQLAASSAPNPPPESADPPC